MKEKPLMTKLTEEDVQHWVEHGGPTKGRLRAIRIEMANLWRDGLITLTRTEDGEIRGRITELGRSVAHAQDQEDAPVCWRCGKSSGAIKKYMVTNTATGSDRVEWMHEDCFAALPLSGRA
jgi:hypothetical protein